MDDLSIVEVNDIEQFRSLREFWNALLPESSDNNIFLTWEWLFFWWQYYGANKELRILLVKESDRIIGIMPLMQSKYRKGFISVHVLENICGMNCDYSGVILTKRKRESVAILLNYLEKTMRSSNIITRISQIPENSGFLTQLREQLSMYSNSLLLDEKRVDSCPYIDLPATWEEYFNTLNRKRRGNLRRAVRDLEQNYNVELIKYKNGDDLQYHLEVLFEFHQKRWQLRNIISKFTETATRNFYLDVSKAFHQNNWLDLSVLNLDGKAASIIWGFNYSGKYYYMTPAFDLDYAEYNVGNIHIMKLIHEAIRNGLRTFDFLKGAEAHKSHWTHYANDNIQVIIAPKGLLSKYRVKLLEIFVKLENIKTRSLLDNFRLLLKKVR